MDRTQGQSSTRAAPPRIRANPLQPVNRRPRPAPPTATFTGQNQDTASDLYDFLYREYHPTQGRWIQTDPAGLAAVDISNPQSWNRYG